MESQKIQNIIIFKQRNIGDVLMITPILRSLKERFSQARIVVVVNLGTEGALENNPDVAEVQVYDRGKYSGLAQVIYELSFLWKLRRERFDLSISFTEGDRAVWYTLLCAAKHRWGWVNARVKSYLGKMAYHKAVPNNHEAHQVEKHYHLLREAGLDLPVYPLRYVPTEAAQNWAEAEWAKPQGGALRVHVHPVSRWLWKAWETRKMAGTIDWLQEVRQAKVVVTTGPNEKEAALAREVVATCRIRPHFIEGTCSLMQLGALTQKADVFLGVDTGPMHFAAAVGTPVVALFGPTNPHSWRPWQVPSVVLHKPCPCNAQGGKEICDWSKVRACMSAISIEEVCAAVDEMHAAGKKTD